MKTIVNSKYIGIWQGHSHCLLQNSVPGKTYENHKNLSQVSSWVQVTMKVSFHRSETKHDKRTAPRTKVVCFSVEITGTKPQPWNMSCVQVPVKMVMHFLVQGIATFIYYTTNCIWKSQIEPRRLSLKHTLQDISFKLIINMVILLSSIW